jgi:amino acid transporter
MATSTSERPRDVNTAQAAAILYGDWGTSKAYVIGLAFAIAGYSSFWLVAAVSVLTAIVGINYITICRLNPTGGGVYSAARRHSEVLALIGAFFLIADYLVTAALSSVSCFEYLGVPYPAICAMGAIFFIGGLNYLGPRQTGTFAVIIASMTFVVVIILGILSIPFLKQASLNIEPLQGGFWKNWNQLATIIIALSGIESIANTTGVIQLDPNSTVLNPSVHQTTKRAIFFVMLEVCFFTAFFSFALNAISGLEIVDGNVNAPDAPGIRDSILRYLGNHFASYQFGDKIGLIFGTIVGFVFAILLLSAVNTAIMALVSLMFVMSRDGEVPSSFQTLNRFGVPIIPLILATVAPAVILIFVHDIVSLAELYAVGFVGAIATNLGVNAIDKSMPMSKGERYLMWVTFILITAIEITLFIDKPNARRFAISIMTIGLILRSFVAEYRQRQWASKKVTLRHASLYTDDTRTPLHEGAILCAIRTTGKTLDFAIEEARRANQPLYILFIREQRVITDEDHTRLWIDDPVACEIFDYAKENSHDMVIKFFYSVSDSPARTIVDRAQQLHVSRIVLGRPRYSKVLQMVRGNIVQEVSDILSPEIDLLVIS